MKKITLILLTSIFISFTYSNELTTKLMIVGEAVWGGWSTDNSAVMLQKNEDPSVFIYTGWIVADKEFKFLTQAQWGNDEYRNNGDTYLSGDGILSGALKLNGDDDKFKISESANYKITCNLSNLTITAEKISYQESQIRHNILYIVGSATAGGWDLTQSLTLTQSFDNPFLFTTVADLSTDGSFKIAVNKYAGYGQKFYYRDASSPSKISEDSNNDLQWSVNETGKYFITVNLTDQTITIEKDTQTAASINKILFDSELFSCGNNLFKIIHKENSNVNVFNLHGVLVKSETISGNNEMFINLSNLNSGLYLIQISNGSRSKLYKVIVQ
ncbi:hypothetical protein MASR2M117_00920 [Paludibacter sp.]